jgi:hypothetical protein
MNEDPVVAEVRRIRKQRASRSNYDIHKIFPDLIMRKGGEDPAHPRVEDASKWAEAVAAANAPTVKEEPPTRSLTSTSATPRHVRSKPARCGGR